MIPDMDVLGDLKNTTSSFSLGADSYNETGEIMVLLKQPGA